MLLGHSISWSQNRIDNIPTGNIIEANTTIEIPVSVIRVANKKLIERKYYINIANAQDSVIDLQKGYIDEQQIIIGDLQNRILECNRINENIRNECEKQRKKQTILGSTTAVFATTTIVTVLICIFKK